MLIRTASAMVLALAAACSAATLRVANWNMANHPNNTEDQQQLRTILNFAAGEGNFDLLAMAETDTASAPDTASVFSSTYGSTYACIVTAADGGGDRTGFVYNTSRLTLISTTTVGTGTITHPSLWAQFRPLGTTGEADLYVYAVHLQSGSTSSIKASRNNQAAVLRADVDKLGSANVIMAGDFNWLDADEISSGVGAYRTLAAAGTGQLTDPVNRVGAWRGNVAYKDLLSQDPDRSLNDRFDMQLISNPLRDGRGLDYVDGSYRVIGNDGTVFPGGVIEPDANMSAVVVSALGQFSDHLPVAANYSYRILGDATGDDKVDFNDFLALQNHYSAAGTFDDGDFNYDGKIDFNDFLILQNHYGASAVGPAATPTADQTAAFTAFAANVPEPVTAFLIVFAIGGLGCGRTCRSRRPF